MDNNEENVKSGNLKEDYIDALKNLINLAEESLEDQDFDSAKTFIQAAKKLIDLQDLGDIVSDYFGYSYERTIDPDEIYIIEDPKYTPQEEFFIPILEAIIELGGKAKVKDVLELVYYKMEGILNSYDYEPLPSNPKQQRWENTAEWAGHDLAVYELIIPYRVKHTLWWKITEYGKKSYKKLKKIKRS
jgi:hypothetical protein